MNNQNLLKSIKQLKELKNILISKINIFKNFRLSLIDFKTSF